MKTRLLLSLLLCGGISAVRAQVLDKAIRTELIDNSLTMLQSGNQWTQARVIVPLNNMGYNAADMRPALAKMRTDAELCYRFVDMLFEINHHSERNTENMLAGFRLSKASIAAIADCAGKRHEARIEKEAAAVTEINPGRPPTITIPPSKDPDLKANLAKLQQILKEPSAIFTQSYTQFKDSLSNADIPFTLSDINSNGKLFRTKIATSDGFRLFTNNGRHFEYTFKLNGFDILTVAEYFKRKKALPESNIDDHILQFRYEKYVVLIIQYSDEDFITMTYRMF